MKKIKVLKVTISILIVIVAITSIINKILFDKCKRDYELQKVESSKTQSAAKEVQDAAIKAQIASIRHLGKELKLENMKLIFPKNYSFQKMEKHPRLVLIFSELGCNVCQDEETRFGGNIASKYGKSFVMAIVHAENQRYARNYIRMNQVIFPVYYCKDESILDQNGIDNTPMIFVIDEDNRIIASHFPLPGHPKYSEPMHEFCYYYFDRKCLK